MVDVFQSFWNKKAFNFFIKNLKYKILESIFYKRFEKKQEYPVNEYYFARQIRLCKKLIKPIHESFDCCFAFYPN